MTVLLVCIIAAPLCTRKPFNSVSLGLLHREHTLFRQQTYELNFNKQNIFPSHNELAPISKPQAWP